MSSRLDVKHERILRSLLKLPDNRRCADCDTLVRLMGRACLLAKNVGRRPATAALLAPFCAGQGGGSAGQPVDRVGQPGWAVGGGKVAACLLRRLIGLVARPHDRPTLTTQGPQYVVTDFNVFVCTVCSGVQ